jgi:CheY-like chemotaxis protein
MARILVIEDEGAVRANLVRFLRLEGHEPLEAVDGPAGVAAGLQERPDLILCDVMMPRLDGFGVLQALRSQGLEVPFLFISASAEPERLESALKKGASGYITKPFQLARLRELLAQHLG